MKEKKILTVKDAIDYVVELSVGRFNKTELHKESLLKQIHSDKKIKNLLSINLFKAQNSIDMLDSMNRNSKTQRQYREVYTNLNNKKISRKHKESLILTHYKSKDSRTLNDIEFNVLSEISTIHDVGKDVILSKYKGIDVVFARYQFMVILHRNLGYTLSKTGMIVSRDHSTVINAMKVHDDIMYLNTDKPYVKKFNKIMNILKEKYSDDLNFGIAKK